MRISLKRIGAFLLVVYNLSIIFYVVANVADWKINYLNINPSEPFDSQMVHIYYPLSEIEVPSLIIGLEGMTGMSFSAKLFLGWQGTLAEETLVEFGASGFMYPDGQKTIDRISVGFEGASMYNAYSNTPASFIPKLRENETYTILVDIPDKLGEISWNSPGDYYPFVTIIFKNGSKHTITYQDQTLKIHVNEYEVIKQEYYNRRNDALTLGAFLLAIPNGLTALGYILTKDRKVGNTKIEDNIIKLIKTVIKENSDNSGWTNLGEIGVRLREKNPGFNHKLYGYKQLNTLISNITEFELSNDKQKVRLKK